MDNRRGSSKGRDDKQRKDVEGMAGNEGKVAVVTGGTRGIGAAIVARLLGAGYTLRDGMTHFQGGFGPSYRLPMYLLLVAVRFLLLGFLAATPGNAGGGVRCVLWSHCGAAHTLHHGRAARPRRGLRSDAYPRRSLIPCLTSSGLAGRRRRRARPVGEAGADRCGEVDPCDRC